MPSPTETIRAEARGRDLPWVAVREAFEELRLAAAERISRPVEIRKTAWMLHTANSPGCWPFWWTGFRNRFGKKLARGHDYTIIPGYDEIGQEIATEFPEYATDDGTQRLWEFLLSDCERMPDRETLYRKAMDWVEFELIADLPADDTICAFSDFPFE